MVRIVVIGASAGGLAPLRRIVAALPVPCSAAVFVVVHVGANPSILPYLPTRAGALPATFPQDGSPIDAGQIYVAPPDHQMILGASTIGLNKGPKVNYTRPAADPLFISAAKSHGRRVIGIVLSGGDSDGAVGLRAITEHGGTAFVQDPAEAASPSMPRSAIILDHPEACLPVGQIAKRVRAFCSERCPT